MSVRIAYVVVSKSLKSSKGIGHAFYHSSLMYIGLFVVAYFQALDSLDFILGSLYFLIK